MTIPTGLRYDVVVIGAGAAGLMAGISVRRNHPGKSIAIIDRTFAAGRKILVCGGGRCNITNLKLDQNTGTHFHGSSPDFIAPVFRQFNFHDIKTFFEDLGVTLVEERKNRSGKMFPLTNQALTVTSVLLDELERNRVDLFLNTECVKISAKKKVFEVETLSCQKERQKNRKIFTAGNVILAAGGKTYPALGSDGSGYRLAGSFGHKIVEPVPASLPLTTGSRLVRKLQGMKIHAAVTLSIEGRIRKHVTDDLLFTKYGLSGSAILAVSRDVSKHLKRGRERGCSVSINFMPEKSAEEAFIVLKKRWSLRPDQTVEKSLFGLVPNKLSKALLDMPGLDPATPVRYLKTGEEREIASALTQNVIEITGTRGWNEAEFTAGGVTADDVDPGTLESTLRKNLYFCGEILDVDGEVGGYNLSWCWSSGWVAGKLSKST